MKFSIPDKEKLIQDFKKSPEKGLLVISIFAVLLLAAFSRSEPQTPEQVLETIDTQVPLGFTLTPIEIINADALTGLIGNYGMASLYTVKTELQQGGLMAADRVKIIRPANNPNKFSALLPDHQVKSFMQYAGPFYAVIQNPKTNEQVKVNSLDRAKSKIKIVESL